MNTATMINLSLVPLCMAVLVQGWRIDRRMKAFRNATLTDGIMSLEHATAQARGVLGELKRVLATDGIAQANTIAEAEAMRDELSMMVGIGNAVAERIVAAAAQPEQKAGARTGRKRAVKAEAATDAATGEKVVEKAAGKAPARKAAAPRKSRARKAPARTTAPIQKADPLVEAAIAAAIAEAGELSAEIVMHPARAANAQRAAA
ncbi:hypothetical protein EDF56_10539 [Novosphingobium sp. PhB165]|uniref:DUF6468 domain-containing protein n=1 Tax=Novosphingobium sp. PhB165 TaxID=2485105 RepID=UPI0010434B85|nr:DUF6468 domain-containing protein [Novosphingobium sp. PhB165]TCM17697.1 hypothetical protein EDF56_10539 [Novosphingobium sp. PhB165]